MGDEDPGDGGLDEFFEILGEIAVASEPGEGSLDTPERLERDEPVGPRGPACGSRS